jgi:phosphomethylpyrimidine synthase
MTWSRCSGVHSLYPDPETAREFHDETLPGEVAKVAHFLLDEVPREVRDYAVREGAAAETVVLAQGLREKADEFRKGGGEIDRKA